MVVVVLYHILRSSSIYYLFGSIVFELLDISNSIIRGLVMLGRVDLYIMMIAIVLYIAFVLLVLVL